MNTHKDSLMWAIAYTAKLQGSHVERLRLHDVVMVRCASLIDTLDNGNQAWMDILENVSNEMGFAKLEKFTAPDPARVPAISWDTERGWLVVRGQAPTGDWLVLDSSGHVTTIENAGKLPCIRMQFADETLKTSEKPAYALFKEVFQAHRKPLWEASLATLIISIIALAVSLFSMQVYDRVIPTQGYETLFVLTFGVVVSLLFDLLLKHVRTELSEESVIQMDNKLSRDIFARLLNVRLDQLPQSLGSLTAQIRSYEGVRTFLSSSTLYLLVELPFGLIFVFLLMIIGSVWLALIPLAFYLIAFLHGLASIKKIEEHAKQGIEVSNLKTGLLVETIEGAETIKSGGGGWRFLSRWIDINQSSSEHDAKLRKTTELGTHFILFFQQVAYILSIALGAYIVTRGEMTIGALVATSILMARATAPATSLYQLIVRYSTAKTALYSLELLYKLERDNHDVARPIVLDKIKGGYVLENVRFNYQNAPRSFLVEHLVIQPGEKVGVLGAIGSGKSTLLRLLTGMYQPLVGKILLDDIDIGQISRALLSDQIGYLQQEHRLFNGTLRENLLIGTLDPGDEAIKDASEKTGLLHVISNHPKGLELPIAEGGKGLSGGQKQLVALTRLLINQPSVWLLDEPTASMDLQTAEKCMSALKAAIRPEHTLLLSTHNPQLLTFVDRLIVIANNKIVLDGPKNEVLRRLQTPATPERKRSHAAKATVTVEKNEHNEVKGTTEVTS